MKPLEAKIHQLLLTSITGKPTYNQTVRNLVSLPSNRGGLAIVNLSCSCCIQTTSTTTLEKLLPPHSTFYSSKQRIIHMKPYMIKWKSRNKFERRGEWPKHCCH